MRKTLLFVGLAAVCAAPALHAQDDSRQHHRNIQHVLLISADGIRAVDLSNCSAT